MPTPTDPSAKNPGPQPPAPQPGSMVRPGPGLGLWWAFIGILGLGLVSLYLGWLHLGGAVMSLAFGFAALVRLVRPQDSGGLQIRTPVVDIVFYLGAAVNVLGAVLLVERLLPLRVLGLVDLALVLVIAVVWGRTERVRRWLAR